MKHRMAVAARDTLVVTMRQRCFWLFAVLLLLITAVSFVPATDGGRLVLNVVNVFVLIATVAAVGRTTLSFVAAALLAVPSVWFQYLGLSHDDDGSLAWSWVFSAALYAIGTGYLLRYVFQPRIMTEDKLFGAASAYLLLAVLWAYIYAIIGFFYPGSFLVTGEARPLVYADALYLSMTVLTSTGFGDVVPLSRQARGVCMIEPTNRAARSVSMSSRAGGSSHATSCRSPSASSVVVNAERSITVR